MIPETQSRRSSICDGDQAEGSGWGKFDLRRRGGRGTAARLTVPTALPAQGQDWPRSGCAGRARGAGRAGAGPAARGRAWPRGGAAARAGAAAARAGRGTGCERRRCSRRARDWPRAAPLLAQGRGWPRSAAAARRAGLARSCSAALAGEGLAAQRQRCSRRGGAGRAAVAVVAQGRGWPLSGGGGCAGAARVLSRADLEQRRCNDRRCRRRR
ncbi:hypothetical protein Scep_029951 [Stephania cephalantha]|uniref:Uncharacterized protein n=1 Tax=Stephania cephalantha TaxID=152367 RepID=A0AAP0E1K5_9MAGN